MASRQGFGELKTEQLGGHSQEQQRHRQAPIDDDALNWIIAFLTDSAQVCKTTDGRFSAVHTITRNIIEGSGIGRTLWIVMASDLRCISDMNLLFKYADDSSLLVPENTNVELADEFSDIQEWADSNGMVINLHKTKEIISKSVGVLASHCYQILCGSDA